jgi:hypothetical protein
MQVKKRKSGIPTGNAGEYFVMGELLRRGFDAQLADRNTKGYDLLVGTAQDRSLRKVQVKTVRSQPWYVNRADFAGERGDQVTVYVLLGAENGAKPVRYFIAKNSAVAKHVHVPNGKWEQNGFMSLKWLLRQSNVESEPVGDSRADACVRHLRRRDRQRI